MPISTYMKKPPQIQFKRNFIHRLFFNAKSLLIGLLLISPYLFVNAPYAIEKGKNNPTARTRHQTADQDRELLPRIQCIEGYTASVYALGLSSPDGLALSPDGLLYVAEESSGEVSLIEENGDVISILDNLQNPEGITFDPEGNLYVVEDIQNGRLIKMAPDGVKTILADSLDAPEGVVWTDGGTLYVTESNAQFAAHPPYDYQTSITAVAGSGTRTSIITKTVFWSFAGITAGNDGMLYVTNEISGVVNGFADSVFKVNPATGAESVFTTNLIAPEGLRFSSRNGFPLYVAEENTGTGGGRLSRIAADGSSTVFCSGFLEIEDVVVDDKGRIFVSEDTSGQVILIEPGLFNTISVLRYLPAIIRDDSD